VDSSTVTKIVKTNLANFYAFAYSLVPDELQAQQIVLDSVTIILKDLNSSSNQLSSTGLLNHLYSILYKVSSKRHEQLKGGFFHNSEVPPFFKQETFERALLFLNHKLFKNEQEISLILDIKRKDIKQGLANSRHRIYEIYHGKPFAISGE